LESIIEPSKVISEQYQNSTLTQKEGTSVTGRIVDETDEKVVLQPNLLSSERVTVQKSDLTARTPSKLSPMPEGLVNSLTQDEILDLLAYIESAGRQQAGH
jgi:putative heme-binding domain-containing protein